MPGIDPARCIACCAPAPGTHRCSHSTVLHCLTHRASPPFAFPQIFNYSPTSSNVACRGFLAPTKKDTCSDNRVALRSVETSGAYFQWRATPVKNMANTYNIVATFRGSSCPRYLGVLGTCSTASQTLGLLPADTKAARWVLERYYPSGSRLGRSAGVPGAGGMFVVDVDGKPTLTTI